MTALSSPHFAPRPLRDGLRQKSSSPLRPRSASQWLSHAGVAADSVFKRLPSIGDTPERDPKRA